MDIRLPGFRDALYLTCAIMVYECTRESKRESERENAYPCSVRRKEAKEVSEATKENLSECRDCQLPFLKRSPRSRLPIRYRINRQSS